MASSPPVVARTRAVSDAETVLAEPDRIPEGEAAASIGDKTDSEGNLSMLHACLHCRASKTACNDQRPCNRCRRLGLECASDREQPRKRACKSCHSAKVACGTLFTDACNRCRRLGLECVPRDPPSLRGITRKRRRSDGEISSSSLSEMSEMAGSDAGMSSVHGSCASLHSYGGSLHGGGAWPIACGGSLHGGSAYCGAAFARAPLGIGGLEQAAHLLSQSSLHSPAPGPDSPRGLNQMASVAVSLLNLSRPSAGAIAAAEPVPCSSERLPTADAVPVEQAARSAHFLGGPVVLASPVGAAPVPATAMLPGGRGGDAAARGAACTQVTQAYWPQPQHVQTPQVVTAAPVRQLPLGVDTQSMGRVAELCGLQSLCDKLNTRPLN